MSPNSRPPLTSRIRASFESKRSKSDVNSPVNTSGSVTQDSESLRNAIDAAINSESFQNAIAANLARIIKPSITDALNTLQPLVESVYSHEVLLRKTNRSVDNILIQLDTQNTRNGEITPQSPGSPRTPTTPRRRGSGSSSAPQDVDQFRQCLEKYNKRTVATLAELSNAVDGNNKTIQQVVQDIGALKATIVPTKDHLESLKAKSEQSNTATAVVQAQLDQLKVDVGTVIDAVGSDLGENVNKINHQVADHPLLLAAHATKLDEISADVSALKGQADISLKLRALSEEFEAVKSTIESSTISSNEESAALGAQVGSVLSVLEANGATLSDLKDAGANPELLAAIAIQRFARVSCCIAGRDQRGQYINKPRDCAC